LALRAGVASPSCGGKRAGSVDGRSLRVFYGALDGARNTRDPSARYIPRIQEIRIDSVVVWFTLGASLLAALRYE